MCGCHGRIALCFYSVSTPKSPSNSPASTDTPAYILGTQPEEICPENSLHGSCGILVHPPVISSLHSPLSQAILAHKHICSSVKIFSYETFFTSEISHSYSSRFPTNYGKPPKFHHYSSYLHPAIIICSSLLPYSYY